MSIQSEIERLQSVKTAIKDAIVESGIDVPDDTPFTEYAGKTSQIVGQFESKLDEIIGGEIVPMLDVQQRLEAINGVPGDVSTQLDTLDSTKTAIAAAIVEKGVEVPEGTTFREYADKIAMIPSGNRKVTVHFEQPAIVGAMGVYGFSINNYLMEIPPMATTFEIELLEGRSMSINPFNVVCCCNMDELAINRVTDKNGQELWVRTDLNFSYFEVPEGTDEIYLYNN